jgi:hypothetical protein
MKPTVSTSKCEEVYVIRERIYAMLQPCATTPSHFPATLLYNEGWLLRLIIDWFSAHTIPHHPFNFLPNAQWFSEALLPTAFQPRYRGDPLSESRTHADGVIGHIVIGSQGKADLSLRSNASQLVILEAKMFSPLSSGTKNARYFDQVARSVAAIAETLNRANLHPSALSELGFYVLAPQEQLARDDFTQKVSRASVQQKVEQRVHEYGGEKDDWYANWFQPTFQRIKIDVISWETIIEIIGQHDRTAGDSFREFYRRCIEFN